jgi:hypothetical protein
MACTDFPSILQFAHHTFWSLTMYDATDSYLVPNRIKLYGISNITPGLKYNAGGSLTMYIQHENPGPNKV